MTKAGPRTIHRERVTEALDLYASGLDVRTIAARMGVSVRQAARYLSDGLRTLPAYDVDDLRAATEVRLDRLARVFAELGESADDERIRLQAAQGLRQVESDRARLLGTMIRPAPAPRDED